MHCLVDVVLWPKILCNKVGVLTSVFKATDYFFGCQKSTFNLENNKCICQGNFFGLQRNWIYLLQNCFFELCVCQGYIQNFERNWKNSVCIRINNFAKSANF